MPICCTHYDYLAFIGLAGTLLAFGVSYLLAR